MPDITSAVLHHNGKTYTAEPARVMETRLGPQGGVWTFTISLLLVGPNAGVDIGGYSILNAHGTALLKEFVETIGVNHWESLPCARLMLLSDPQDPSRPVGIASEHCERVLIFDRMLARLVCERPRN